MKLKVYTAVWTPEDVEHGANDPENTTSETHEFADADELLEYLRREGLLNASVYPVRPGADVSRVWLSDDPYEHPYTGVRYERTAHRGHGISDEQWTDIVLLVTRN